MVVFGIPEIPGTPGIDPDLLNPDMLPGQFMLKWPNLKINWNRYVKDGDHLKIS